MNTIEIYKDRNDNYYVQAGDYKVRIADGTRHDGTTIGHFELVKKLTIPVVVVPKGTLTTEEQELEEMIKPLRGKCIGKPLKGEW